jgi:molybdenum cofactor cytidylyltransferase
MAPGPAALLLAAGGSRRWGGAPKALLRIGATTALGHIVRTLAACDVDARVIVLGSSAEVVAHEARRVDPALEVVDHPGWREGRTSSIQAGLRAIGAERDVLVWPVDQPLARAETVRRLLAQARSDRLATWIVPTFEGHGGHPVLLKPPARELVGSLGPDAPLRALHGRIGPQLLRLAVDDPGVVVNLNTPESYEQAMDRMREGALGPWTGR